VLGEISSSRHLADTYPFIQNRQGHPMESRKAMDLPSETRVWKPKGSATLVGAFHLLGGLNWAIKTEDGSIWLLEADAENQLQALHLDEGRTVWISHTAGGSRGSKYEVSLTQEGVEEDIVETDPDAEGIDPIDPMEDEEDDEDD
jgi:hypothetical protein